MTSSMERGLIKFSLVAHVTSQRMVYKLSSFYYLTTLQSREITAVGK